MSMRSKRVVELLATEIQQDTAGIVAIDEIFRHSDGGGFSLACRDKLSGYRFQIHSVQQWRTRIADIREE